MLSELAKWHWSNATNVSEMIQTKAIFSFCLFRRNSRHLGRVELDHLLIHKVIMQDVLFHFKIEPIKPLPTYLQRPGISTLNHTM
jgi:hypothetical protein